MKSNTPLLKLIFLVCCFVHAGTFICAQNTQPTNAITYSVKKDGDAANAVWKRIIRLFSDRDIPINTIDRNSGFILSGTVSFTNAYAIDSVPAPGDSAAYVIAQSYYWSKQLVQPSYITGQIKIFVLDDSSSTECRVSIEGLKDYDLDSYYSRHSTEAHYYETDRNVRSTGLLEKMIGDYIVGKTNSVNINLVKGAVINPRANRTALLQKTASKTVVGLSVAGAGLFVGLATVGIYEATKGKK